MWRRDQRRGGCSNFDGTGTGICDRSEHRVRRPGCITGLISKRAILHPHTPRDPPLGGSVCVVLDIIDALQRPCGAVSRRQPRNAGSTARLTDVGRRSNRRGPASARSSSVQRLAKRGDPCTASASQVDDPRQLNVRDVLERKRLHVAKNGTELQIARRSARRKDVDLPLPGRVGIKFVAMVNANSP